MHNRLISESYRSLNADLHKRAVFGQRGDRHALVVRDLINEFGGPVLDYGCGRATLAASMPDVDVRNYDPAIPKYAADPEPCPIVICTDVLEHIEPDCLDAVLAHLERLTLKVAHLVVATKPDGNKKLADGRDPHLIVKPAEWWLPKLREFMPARLINVTARDCTFRVTR